MFIEIDANKRKAMEREKTHKELVRTQIGGPAESFMGKGPGISEAIGPNADRMIKTMMNPEFIEKTFGSVPLQIVKDKRKILTDLGRHGFNGQMPGKSVRGDLQYFGEMPLPMFITLMWTDPTIFDDEKRLEDHLIRSGLSVVKPRE